MTKELENFYTMVYKTGIADYYKFSNKMPNYWDGKPEAKFWQAGYNKAKEVQFRIKPR